MTLEQSIEDWIASLEREVAEADINATHAQIELWAQFGRYPDMPQVGQGVFEGWVPDRFLDWAVIDLQFYLRPVKQGFFKRIGPALRWLFKGNSPANFNGLIYELVEKNSNGALKVQVSFSKSDGKITSKHTIGDHSTNLTQ